MVENCSPQVDQFRALAIAEKTSIEEVLGSSHSASFPGHLGYQDFFQERFSVQPLMDRIWSHYSLESRSDMAKVAVLQKAADAHAERVQFLAKDLERPRYRRPERDDLQREADNTAGKERVGEKEREIDRY